MDVGKTNTTPHSHCRMPDEQTKVMHHPRSRDSSAGVSRHSLVNVWVRMLRNGTGQDAEFVREINYRGDFNRQLWWAVVNTQNTSVLLQRASWDTLLLLSHPHPSEPKEVYQYLDALEVGKFELHVPVSGDLKENKKQGVKHHTWIKLLLIFNTERNTVTQLPSRRLGTAGTWLSPKTPQAFQARAMQLRLHKDCCSHYRANIKLVLHPLIQSE